MGVGHPRGAYVHHDAVHHRLRERRGISLRDIANNTKLSMRTLEALERNDIARLPGGIFSRGLVRVYAEQIGADPEATGIFP